MSFKQQEVNKHGEIIDCQIKQISNVTREIPIYDKTYVEAQEEKLGQVLSE